VLMLLILPLVSAIDVPLDLVSLQSNCINLVAAAGTMATLSLAFLFERMEAVTLPQRVSRQFARTLSISSILYFLLASTAGLMYETQGSNIVFMQILFWYTIFGVGCLTAITVILFLSRIEVVL